MCKCFEKMLEKRYAEKRCYYDEDSHDFLETDEYIMRLLDSYIVINNCPVCGMAIEAE